MALNEIFKPISQELYLMNQELRRQLDSLTEDPQMAPAQKAHVGRLVNHFFQAPGKGLRPALVLLAAKLAGPVAPAEPSYQPLIKLATAVELLHSASLTHDDVVDQAHFRREQVSLNAQYGNRIAVVVGDALILQAYALLLNLETDKKEPLFRILYQTAQKMCLGEMFEHHILTERRTAQLEEYVQLLEHKTAALMSACCECGAMLTGNDPAAYENLANFGLHFGLAFQLADDSKDQDSVWDQEADLVPLVTAYIKKAKADLHVFNDNPVTPNLLALCDLLLPGNGAAGIFDQKIMLS